MPRAFCCRKQPCFCDNTPLQGLQLRSLCGSPSPPLGASTARDQAPAMVGLCNHQDSENFESRSSSAGLQPYEEKVLNPSCSCHQSRHFCKLHQFAPGSAARRKSKEHETSDLVDAC